MLNNHGRTRTTSGNGCIFSKRLCWLFAFLPYCFSTSTFSGPYATAVPQDCFKAGNCQGEYALSPTRRRLPWHPEYLGTRFVEEGLGLSYNTSGTNTSRAGGPRKVEFYGGSRKPSQQDAYITECCTPWLCSTACGATDVPVSCSLEVQTLTYPMEFITFMQYDGDISEQRQAAPLSSRGNTPGVLSYNTSCDAQASQGDFGFDLDSSCVDFYVTDWSGLAAIALGSIARSPHELAEAIVRCCAPMLDSFQGAFQVFSNYLGGLFTSLLAFHGFFTNTDLAQKHFNELLKRIATKAGSGMLSSFLYIVTVPFVVVYSVLAHLWKDRDDRETFIYTAAIFIMASVAYYLGSLFFRYFFFVLRLVRLTTLDRLIYGSAYSRELLLSEYHSYFKDCSDMDLHSAPNYCSRPKTIRQLRETHPHVVVFTCKGHLVGNGAVIKSDKLTRPWGTLVFTAGHVLAQSDEMIFVHSGNVVQVKDLSFFTVFVHGRMDMAFASLHSYHNSNWDNKPLTMDSGTKAGLSCRVQLPQILTEGKCYDETAIAQSHDYLDDGMQFFGGVSPGASGAVGIYNGTPRYLHVGAYRDNRGNLVAVGMSFSFPYSLLRAYDPEYVKMYLSTLDPTTGNYNLNYNSETSTIEDSNDGTDMWFHSFYTDPDPGELVSYVPGLVLHGGVKINRPSGKRNKLNELEYQTMEKVYTLLEQYDEGYEDRLRARQSGKEKEYLRERSDDLKRRTKDMIRDIFLTLRRDSENHTVVGIEYALRRVCRMYNVPFQRDWMYKVENGQLRRYTDTETREMLENFGENFGDDVDMTDVFDNEAARHNNIKPGSRGKSYAESPNMPTANDMFNHSATLRKLAKLLVYEEHALVDGVQRSSEDLAKLRSEYALRCVPIIQQLLQGQVFEQFVKPIEPLSDQSQEDLDEICDRLGLERHMFPDIKTAAEMTQAIKDSLEASEKKINRSLLELPPTPQMKSYVDTAVFNFFSEYGSLLGSSLHYLLKPAKELTVDQVYSVLLEQKGQKGKAEASSGPLSSLSLKCVNWIQSINAFYGSGPILEWGAEDGSAGQLQFQEGLRQFAADVHKMIVDCGGFVTYQSIRLKHEALSHTKVVEKRIRTIMSYDMMEMAIQMVLFKPIQDMVVAAANFCPLKVGALPTNANFAREFVVSGAAHNLATLTKKQPPRLVTMDYTTMECSFGLVAQYVAKTIVYKVGMHSSWLPIIERQCENIFNAMALPPSGEAIPVHNKLSSGSYPTILFNTWVTAMMYNAFNESVGKKRVFPGMFTGDDQLVELDEEDDERYVKFLTEVGFKCKEIVVGQPHVFYFDGNLYKANVAGLNFFGLTIQSEMSMEPSLPFKVEYSKQSRIICNIFVLSERCANDFQQYRQCIAGVITNCGGNVDTMLKLVEFAKQRWAANSDGTTELDDMRDVMVRATAVHSRFSGMHCVEFPDIIDDAFFELLLHLGQEALSDRNHHKNNLQSPTPENRVEELVNNSASAPIDNPAPKKKVAALKKKARQATPSIKEELRAEPALTPPAPSQATLKLVERTGDGKGTVASGHLKVLPSQEELDIEQAKKLSLMEPVVDYERDYRRAIAESLRTFDEHMARHTSNFRDLVTSAAKFLPMMDSSPSIEVVEPPLLSLGAAADAVRKLRGLDFAKATTQDCVDYVKARPVELQRAAMDSFKRVLTAERFEQIVKALQRERSKQTIVTEKREQKYRAVTTTDAKQDDEKTFTSGHSKESVAKSSSKSCGSDGSGSPTAA